MENSNFYKSKFQLGSLAGLGSDVQALPPDKFSGFEGQSINFLTNKKPRDFFKRPTLYSNPSYETFVDNKGPLKKLKENRLENFKNFKALRRHMDKAYLMMKSNDV